MDALGLIQAVLPSLCVSVLMMVFNRRQSRADAAAKQEEGLRRDSEQVQLELLLASAKLSYAVAMAIKNGHPNGEVEEGVAQYRRSMEKFKQFERSLVVERSAQV